MSTIKDIAIEANVSIATVSHVLNGTRFVSPELIKQVMDAAEKLNYKSKASAKESSPGRIKSIAVIVPDITKGFFAEMIKSIEDYLKDKGYATIIYSCNEDEQREFQYIQQVIQGKKYQGLIIAPITQNNKKFKALNNSGLPIVFVDRVIEGIEADAVLSDNAGAMYRATSHLIKSGHERIGLLLWTNSITPSNERLKGYLSALKEYGIEFDRRLVINTDENGGDYRHIFKCFMDMENRPTAIICATNRLTLSMLRYVNEYEIDCPKDISIIGYDNNEWGMLFNPSLTSIVQHPEQMGSKAAERLLMRIQKNDNNSHESNVTVRIPVDIKIRKSTQIIGRGPFGEKAVYPDELTLSESEAEEIKKGNYTAAISFHYSGKAWMRLHEQGIKDVFNKLGIKLISVTDAHFDASLQCKQLEGLLLQEPDIIISIPTDEVITAPSYRKITQSNSKLVLINNVPEGLKHGDYVTCVSVNERENGYNAGKILGEYFKNTSKVNVGLITHGEPFFATKQRDLAAEQVLVEEYPNIEITARESFHKEEKVYSFCREMIMAHPDIKGIYVSWEGPALNVIRALTDLGREDISVVTCDLDLDVALYMAKGKIIKGLSCQRPYEQGMAMAYAAANALLGKSVHPFIGVKPYSVTRNNLMRAWKDIIKEKEPHEILEALKIP